MKQDIDNLYRPQKESFQEFRKRSGGQIKQAIEENRKLTQEELDKKYGM